MSGGGLRRLGRSLRHPASWLPDIRKRLSNRGDTEHEQALIRIGIVSLLLVYSAIAPLPQPETPWWVPTVAQVGYIVIPLSILHFAWIIAQPAVHQVRRAVWMAIDHGGIVVAMAVGGEPMALLYPLLLWVTLGHGFRYGPAHLIGSALISVVLFAPLVFFHPFWQAKGAFGVGLILGLVLIPGYCLRLLRHLHDARRRAEASSEAKSRFLATMSHELRTPLHAILGMAELLRGSSLGHAQRDMTRTIHSAGHTLLNMIEDILDIARIEAGAARNEVERFDVHKLLHGIRDMLGYRARMKSLDLHLRFAPDLPADIEGPRRSLEQILLNLVTNAIKFTDDGYVRVEASLVGREGTRLRVIITDTGCGIPTSAQSRIFESFTQVDETTTRRHGGSGLGLAIVKRLVEQADGSLVLTSELDEGTTFEIELPIAVYDDSDASTTGLVVVHGAPTAAQRQVLEASGLSVSFAAEMETAAISVERVDLWCRVGGAPRPAQRHGRDLILWGDGSGIDEALVVLPDDADVALVRRAVDAALVVDDDVAENDGLLRVQAAELSLDVLVADDHRINQQVIERLLTRGGHRAVVVDSGEAALEAIDRSSFDVVVLDLNMPGMGGLAAARLLAARDQRPRMVALTADVTEATRHACLAAGFDDFLTKPVDGTRLLEAIDEVADPVSGATRRLAAGPEAPRGVRPATVLDEKRLNLLRQLDDGDGFVAEIIDGFIHDGSGLVEDIKAAAADGDLQRFRDSAHALRSAATHLGAVALFEQCLAVKSLDAPTLRAEAIHLGETLDTAFAQVSEALERAKHAHDEHRLDQPPPRAVSSPTA